MPSIEDILKNLGVEEEEQTKVASSLSQEDDEIERQAIQLGLVGNDITKTASQQNRGESNMDLNEFYNMHFGQTKVASAATTVQTQDEDFSKEASLENMGELAGVSFAQGLNERLLQFTIKTAMEAAPDSEATKAIQSGAGVIPGATVANPQLDVNKNRDGQMDDKGLSVMTGNTSPYTLEDKAVEKARILAAIASAQPGDLSHKTVSTNSGLQVGGSQKDA